jgi:predicted nucleic acid-binding protein
LSSCYLDASAIVKLATLEDETQALRAHLSQYRSLLTSRLATVEVPRALKRRGAETEAAAAGPMRQIFEFLQVVELDEGVAATAAGLAPASLRSLDAIHLASALAIGEDLTEFVTYDARLAAAARGAGLEVQAPGQRP